MTELIESGIVERCSKAVGGDEDLVQDIYLAILEEVRRKGQKWLDDKRSGGWLEPYVYVMCRNKLYQRNDTVLPPDERDDMKDELGCISDRLDDMWLLEKVNKFIERREPLSDGWYEREILHLWLKFGSWRRLSDELRLGDITISHQSLFATYRKIISELNEYLYSLGYKRGDGGKFMLDEV